MDTQISLLQRHPTIKRIQCNSILQVVRCKVGVSHHLLNACMPENLLQGNNISPVHHEMASESVAIQHTFNKDTLKDPCFDVIYYGRDCGMPVEVEELQNLAYVLIVLLKAKETPELYNNIRQRYQTLQPIQIKQQIRIQS